MMASMMNMMSMYPPPPPPPPMAYPPPPPPAGNYYNPTPVAVPAPAPYYMPPAPGYMPPQASINYGGVASSAYVTTVRPPYGVMPGSNYGSTYNPAGSTFGPSSVYGIGSRPTNNYYSGYPPQQQQQQQPPYFNNYGGPPAGGSYYPPQPMNIAYHGTAW
jgi:hypothetical protein